MQVHQFVPTLAAGDAVGQHALRLRRVLRDAGIASDIYADDIHEPMRREALHFRQYEQRVPGDRTILFQASTGSPLTDFVRTHGDPLLVNYHNITPARFFDRWEPMAAANMREARRQLRTLAPATRLAIAVSTFNESDLRSEGFERTAVSPLLIDFAELDGPPHGRTSARLRRENDAGGARWLFVGRVAPNKCHHDLVAAFAAYRRLFDPAARLTMVGGATAPLYWKALMALAAELGVDTAVELTDTLTFPQVLAHWRAAHVFVCVSEHEGFNAPVLEAMHFGIPVVAYASSAIPETVGDGGILLDDKDPLLVATAVDRALTDEHLRTELVAAGKRRVEHFSLANTGRRMLETITDALEQPDA